MFVRCLQDKSDPKTGISPFSCNFFLLFVLCCSWWYLIGWLVDWLFNGVFCCCNCFFIWLLLFYFFLLLFWLWVRFPLFGSLKFRNLTLLLVKFTVRSLVLYLSLSASCTANKCNTISMWLAFQNYGVDFVSTGKSNGFHLSNCPKCLTAVFRSG